MAFTRAIARSVFLASALASAHAFADDAPVEKPAVDKPALPQPVAESPAEAAPESTEARAPARATRTGNADAGRGDRQRSFVYFAAGPGLLWGLSGGADFERTNPALTGAVGVEVPLNGATGFGLELNGDLELAAASDRGTYTGALLRARLGRMLTPRNRVWGAVGVGGAGYESGSLAFGVAAGTSLLLVPKFGLDFSANLNLLGAASNNRANAAGAQNAYGGGAVLLIAIRALFELHR